MPPATMMNKATISAMPDVFLPGRIFIDEWPIGSDGVVNQPLQFIPAECVEVLASGKGLVVVDAPSIGNGDGIAGDLAVKITRAAYSHRRIWGQYAAIK